jgi:hypothetical protein
MADLLIDNQSFPSTPASSKSVVFVDATTKKLMQMDDGGILQGILSRNSATASQGAGFAADTYVTNSGLLIPSCGMKAGMLFRWLITASKTAASTATPVYTVRIGTGQATSDTSRLALTAGAAQTAAADNGLLIVTVQVRNVGASGVIAGGAFWAKTQAGTAGFGGSIDGASSTFDNSALAGNYVGLSINGGTSAAWTLTSCHAELIG